MSYPDKLWVMVRLDKITGREWYDSRTFSITPIGALNRARFNEEESDSAYLADSPRVAIVQVELKEVEGTRTLPYSKEPVTSHKAV